MRLHFTHKPDPHIEERKKHKGLKRKDVGSSFNDKLALALTVAVGSMWCAYFFAILALTVLPEAIHGGLLTLIQWLSQTFIQLVMLSVIMVGQNILGKASDKRAEMTYKDADATFHEARQIQEHLQVQDDALNAMMERLEKIEAGLSRPQT